MKKFSSLAFHILLAAVLFFSFSSRVSAHPGNLAHTTLKTIIIDNYAPYTFVNAEGQPDGFSLDLMRAVAKVMGFDLEIKVDTWDNARHALENGSIDFLPMMAFSEERDKLYDFSPPHTIAYDAFFTRKDASPIRSMDDLRGKNIIVMESDQAHDYLLSHESIPPEQLILIDSLPQALQLLASGKGDTAIMPKLVGLTLVKDLNLTNLELSPVVVEAYERPFSFAVREGNQAVLERLNQGISIVKATGQYDEIYSNWFGTLESNRLSTETFLKVMGWIIAAFVVIGAMLLTWSFSLRRQVAARTKALVLEVEERKQAIEALRESEFKLQSMFAHSHDAIGVSKKGTHLFVNPSYVTMFGYENEDELIRIPVTDLIAPESRDEVIKNIQDRANGLPAPSEYEVIALRKDGSTFNMNVRVSTYVFKGEQYTLVLLQNISERKQAEEALREKEEQYRAVAESSSDYIMRYDRNFRHIYANQKAIEVTGLPPEQYIGKTHREMGFSEHLCEMWEQNIQKVFDTGKPEKVEIAVELAQGMMYLDLAFSPEFSPDGSVNSVIGVSRDVTERKQAEKYLSKVLERLNLAAHAARLGIWDWNIEKNELFWDEHMYELYGISKENFSGAYEAWLNGLHPDDRAMSDEISKQALQGVRKYDTEFRVIWPDGSIHYLKAEALVIRASDGAPLRMTGINYDITERKQAEQALRESHELFSLYMRHSPIYTYIKTITATESRVLQASSNFIEMIGISGEDMVGRTMEELFPPEFAAKITADDWDVVTSGEVVKLDENLNDRNYITIKFPIVLGGKTLLAGYTIDITERKQAEEVLHQSEALFRSTFELPLAGRAITSPEKAWLDVNNTLCEMLGYSKDELMKKTWVELTHPDDLAANLELFDRAKAGEIDGYSLEKRFIHKDGHIIHTSLAVQCMRRPDRSINYLVSQFLDITERKQAEEALKENEQLLRNMNDNSPLGMHFYKLNNANQLIFMGANPAADKLLGVDHSRFIGKMIEEAFPSLVQTEVPKSYRDAAANGIPWATEQIVYEDRQITGAFEVRAFQTTPGNMVAVFSDITKRKQVEEDLRHRIHEAEVLHQAAASLTVSLELNQVLESLLSQLAQVVEYDSATVFLLQDDQLLGVAGRDLPSPEKVIGQKFPTDNELFQEMQKTGRPLIIADVQKDTRFQGWGGTQHIHGWMGIPLVLQGKLIGRLTIDSLKVNAYVEADAKLALSLANQAAIAIQNAHLFEQAQQEITERKLVEDSLRASEAFSKAILDHSPIGISVRSRTGSLLSANEAWQKIWGMTDVQFQENLATQRNSLYFDERDNYLKAYHTELRRVYEQGGHLHLPALEVTHPKPGGAQWISQHFYAIQDANGQVDRVVILTEDITKSKQAEQSLKEYNLRLETAVEERTHELREAQERLVRHEKLAVIGQMAGSVGHELRNPLAVISSAIYYLNLVQPDADDHIKKYLGIIDQEVHNSEKIIADLLDFARIKSVNREAVSVAGLIRQTLERFPTPPSVDVTIDSPPDLPQVFVDPLQLTQVLGNLTVNACQALPNGGQLNVSCHQQGEMIAIKVKDNGLGIAPENMKKLFEPLFTTKTKGIGLGLAVSQKLVEVNKGFIEVESESGKGSTFTVWLPVYSPPLEWKSP